MRMVVALHQWYVLCAHVTICNVDTYMECIHLFDEDVEIRMKILGLGLLSPSPFREIPGLSDTPQSFEY
jgi:hypothetical protein